MAQYFANDIFSFLVFASFPEMPLVLIVRIALILLESMPPLASHLVTGSLGTMLFETNSSWIFRQRKPRLRRKPVLVRANKDRVTCLCLFGRMVKVPTLISLW